MTIPLGERKSMSKIDPLETTTAFGQLNWLLDLYSSQIEKQPKNANLKKGHEALLSIQELINKLAAEVVAVRVSNIEMRENIHKLAALIEEQQETINTKDKLTKLKDDSIARLEGDLKELGMIKELIK